MKQPAKHTQKLKQSYREGERDIKRFADRTTGGFFRFRFKVMCQCHINIKNDVDNDDDIIITTIIIIIITLKGANRDFYILLTAPRTVSDTTLKWPGRNRVQITCNTSGAHHVQHVVCYVVRRDSPAIKFDKVKIDLFELYFIG